MNRLQMLSLASKSDVIRSNAMSDAHLAIDTSLDPSRARWRSKLLPRVGNAG